MREVGKIEYPNLDVLRAAAVTLVTASHLFSFYGWSTYFKLWGPLGVAIFFVHTSLVLTQSLDYQKGALYVPFLIRRCFRIYPLAIVVLSTVVLFRIPQAFSEFGHHFVSHSYKLQEVVANFLLMQDLLYALPAYSRQALPVNTSIVGPMWSLSVEMLMYLVLPVLFFVVNREQRRAVALAGMYLAVVLFSIAGVRRFPLVEFFFYAPVFASGIVSYYLLRRQRFVVPGFCWPIFLAVACSVLPMSRVPMLCWGLVVALAIPWFAQITSRPLAHAAKLIARYSYGIYLTHCLCMWVALEKLPGPTVLRLMAFFALLVIVSVGLYHGVEEPLIQVGKRVAARVDDAFSGARARNLPNRAQSAPNVIA